MLLISEELEELLALCDRIYVIYEGQIMGEVTDGNIETIGLMMTGTPLEQIRPRTRSNDPWLKSTPDFIPAASAV